MDGGKGGRDGVPSWRVGTCGTKRELFTLTGDRWKEKNNTFCIFNVERRVVLPEVL